MHLAMFQAREAAVEEQKPSGKVIELEDGNAYILPEEGPSRKQAGIIDRLGRNLTMAFE